MDFKEVIDKRYSCRNYLDKKISKKLLLEFIKDASKAPSAANRQPWFYCVLNSKKNVDFIKKTVRDYYFKKHDFYKKNLSKNLLEVANNFYYNLGNCQAVVFVCTDKKLDLSIIDNTILSIGASVENFMLSAENKGIKSCWIGHFHNNEKEFLKKKLIPKNKKIVTGFILGYEKDPNLRLIRIKKKIKDISLFV